MLMGLFGPRLSKGQQYHGLRDDFCDRLDIFIIISIVFLAQGLSRVKDGLLVTEVDLNHCRQVKDRWCFQVCKVEGFLLFELKSLWDCYRLQVKSWRTTYHGMLLHHC